MDNKVLQLKPQSINADSPYINELSIRESEPRSEDERLLEKRYISDLTIDNISRSPYQTREDIREEELEELKNSIISKGIIQPIIVRENVGNPFSSTRYELIAGERRLRAAKLAGIKKIPAIVLDLGDQESLELSIIENAQRENLNPIEEAQGYKMLTEQFQLSQTDAAKIIGKNRATIANALRLLQLESEIIELLKSGELTAGHGRALLAIDDPMMQLKLARLAVKKALSVRALEAIVSRLDEFQEESIDDPEEEIEKETAQLRRLEEKICEFLGIEKVKVKNDPNSFKKITLSFPTEASWKRFVTKIRE